MGCAAAARLGASGTGHRALGEADVPPGAAPAAVTRRTGPAPRTVREQRGSSPAREGGTAAGAPCGAAPRRPRGHGAERVADTEQGHRHTQAVTRGVDTDTRTNRVSSSSRRRITALPSRGGGSWQRRRAGRAAPGGGRLLLSFRGFCFGLFYEPGTEERAGCASGQPCGAGSFSGTQLHPEGQRSPSAGTEAFRDASPRGAGFLGPGQ